MKVSYPKLELLNYQTQFYLQQHLDEEKYNNLDLLVEIFPQCWSSTALGFDGIGGQAMTTAYTSVFYDINQNIYIVYFGERIAYCVENPTDKFFEDLKNKNLGSVAHAMDAY